MRKFIFTLLTVIAVLIAAVLVSPYFIGERTQKLVLKQLDTFNQTPPYSAYVTITADHYQRHWFYSEAKINITLHTPAGTQQQSGQHYTYDAIIKHGPVFFIKHNGSVAIHFGPGAILIQGKSNSTRFDGVLGVILKWRNTPDLFADIPSLMFHDTAGNTYTCDHLAFNTQDHNTAHPQYTFSLAKITAQLANPLQQGMLEVNNVKLIITGHQVEALWLGSADFSIDNALFSLAGQAPLMTIKNITLHVDSDLNSDKTKINSSTHFNIDSLDVAGKIVKPITLTYSINGIDAKASEQFRAVVQQIQHNNSGNTGSVTAPQEDMQALNALIQTLESGFTIELNKLYIGLPKDLASSPLSAHAQLTIKPNNNIMEKLINVLSGGADANSTPDPRTMNEVRNAIVSDLAGIPTKKGATLNGPQPVESKIVNSIPYIMNEVKMAIVASGEMSIPQSLVERLLLQHYTEELIELAAYNQNITQTPQELTTLAYDYLTHNKMLIANSDGSMTLSFTFDKGQLLINNTQPALDLPKPSQPATQIATPISTPTSE